MKLWLCEVLLALHYIHGRHVLHRDIKSSNIFLTAEADVQIGGMLPAARAASLLIELWHMSCLLLTCSSRARVLPPAVTVAHDLWLPGLELYS